MHLLQYIAYSHDGTAVVCRRGGAAPACIALERFISRRLAAYKTQRDPFAWRTSFRSTDSSLLLSGDMSGPALRIEAPNGSTTVPVQLPQNPEEDRARDRPDDVAQKVETDIEDLDTEEEINGYGHGV